MSVLDTISTGSSGVLGAVFDGFESIIGMSTDVLRESFISDNASASPESYNQQPVAVTATGQPLSFAGAVKNYWWIVALLVAVIAVVVWAVVW